MRVNASNFISVMNVCNQIVRTKFPDISANYQNLLHGVDFTFTTESGRIIRYMRIARRKSAKVPDGYLLQLTLLQVNNMSQTMRMSEDDLLYEKVTKYCDNVLPLLLDKYQPAQTVYKVAYPDGIKFNKQAHSEFASVACTEGELSLEELETVFLREQYQSDVILQILHKVINDGIKVKKLLFELVPHYKDI